MPPQNKQSKWRSSLPKEAGHVFRQSGKRYCQKHQNNRLAEYCLPAVKSGGLFIAMKGPNVDEEIKAATNALTILGGSLEKVLSFKLPLLGDERNLLLIRKEAPTPAKYPRRAGAPQKKPL
jgi:16S rRNA (guanine527-N7)-methyltransferase